MRNALIPGSFDPITVGHMDLIRRAAAMFDHVTVLAAVNSDKHYMLAASSRLALIEDAVSCFQNVSADSFEGLVVDYCASHDISVLLKGVRNETDFIYERNMAETNELLSMKKYGKAPETILLMAPADLCVVSSSYVRELLKYREDVSDLVPNVTKLMEELDRRS